LKKNIVRELITEWKQKEVIATVYALLNANINQIANRIDRKIETVEPKTEPVSPARRIRRPKQQNWVNGWR